MTIIPRADVERAVRGVLGDGMFTTAVTDAVHDAVRAWQAANPPAGLSDPSAATGGKHRRDHGDTPRKSAAHINPKVGTQRHLILTCIGLCQPDGLTDEQIQRKTGLPANSERPRRVELVEGGWLCDTGRRRPVSSGEDAVVWGFTAAGWANWRNNRSMPKGTGR